MYFLFIAKLFCLPQHSNYFTAYMYIVLCWLAGNGTCGLATSSFGDSWILLIIEEKCFEILQEILLLLL